jgi:hypothetical protein
MLMFMFNYFILFYASIKSLMYDTKSWNVNDNGLTHGWVEKTHFLGKIAFYMYLYVKIKFHLANFAWLLGWNDNIIRPYVSIFL